MFMMKNVDMTKKQEQVALMTVKKMDILNVIHVFEWDVCIARDKQWIS